MVDKIFKCVAAVALVLAGVGFLIGGIKVIGADQALENAKELARYEHSLTAGPGTADQDRADALIREAVILGAEKGALTANIAAARAAIGTISAYTVVTVEGTTTITANTPAVDAAPAAGLQYTFNIIERKDQQFMTVSNNLEVTFTDWETEAVAATTGTPVTALRGTAIPAALQPFVQFFPHTTKNTSDADTTQIIDELARIDTSTTAQARLDAIDARLAVITAELAFLAMLPGVTVIPLI